MNINSRSILLLFVTSSLLFAGCDKPILHNRPSDRACMLWLDGRTILVEKGVLFDDTWTIHKEAFTSFDIQSITSNSDGTATATVQFEVKDGMKSLRVNGRLLYHYHKQDDACEMISFTVTRLLKLGKW